MEEQLRKAFEEVTTRNIEMIKEFSKETRELTRKLEENVQKLQNTVINRDEQIRQMQVQIASILQEKYKGGS